MKKVHQNIILDGIDQGDKGSRKFSKFCNEGKWDNFIKPYLPKDCEDMTFVELGSNAGLFLRKAKERGFRRVVGVERSRGDCEVATKYRDNFGLDYKIINEKVVDGFDFNKLPVADFTLLANLHYHMDIRDFLYLIDNLEHKTQYCIVVSVNSGPQTAHWRPWSIKENTQHYFRNWSQVGIIEDLPLEGDPHPRTMYSLLFESQLKRIPIDSLTRGGNKLAAGEELGELTGLIRSGEKFDLKTTEYYKDMVVRRRDRLSKEEIMKFVEDKLALIRSLIADGQIQPVTTGTELNLLDGGHRVSALKKLDYKSVMTRIL